MCQSVFHLVAFQRVVKPVDRCQAKALNCAQGCGFDEDELRLWLAESLLALEYIHSQGVIHRDIKPSNLFLNDSRDILIGDFGLATYRRGGSLEDHSFVGTAAYMSPEIVTEEGHSFATDIWRAPKTGDEFLL